MTDPNEDGRQRVIIEGVEPEIDGGRFPIKRTAGESVVVEADIYADGHDAISAVLLHRADGDAEWIEAPMEPLENDRWRGSFTLPGIELPLEALGLDTVRPYQAHDLITQARYLWHGPRNYVEIDPVAVPAHVFRLRRRIRTERDFDYFM